MHAGHSAEHSKAAPRRRRWLLGAILLAVMTGVRAAAPEIVNFRQAVRLALTANPRALASAAQVQAARAGVTEARGRALPQLSLVLDAARSNNPLNVFGYRLAERGASFADFGLGEYTGPGFVNTAPAALNVPGYANNYDTGVVLSVPLFAGGADREHIKESRALLAAARQGDAAARAGLVYEVLQAYAGVRATRELATAARQALAAARVYAGTAASLYRQGIVIESDVLLAKAHEESARAALSAAEAEVLNQLDAFRLLIGRPGSDLVPGPAVKMPAPIATLRALEDQALAHNPQLLATRSREAAGEAATGAARAAFWPQVNLVLRHDWNADSPALRAPSNTVMALFSWQLFNSGAQYGALQRAAAEQRRAAAQYQATADAVRLAVDRTFRGAETAALQAQASDLIAAQARQAAHLLSLRYAQGLTTLAQLLDGQARLDAARAGRVQAHYAALLARARLRLLTNELDAAPATSSSTDAGTAKDQGN